MIRLESSEVIYDYVEKSIVNIVNVLSQNSDDEKFEKTKVEVLNIINFIKQEKLDKAIKDLKEYQEWDKFTVAFYGETNAGKSTIIEALRIYFKEEEKFNQQNKFKTITKKYHENKNSFESKLHSIKNCILEQEIKSQELTINFQTKENEFEEELNQIIMKDLRNKKNSLVYRLLSSLHIINVQKVINKRNLAFNEVKVKYGDAIKSINEILKAHNDILKKVENDIQVLDADTFDSLQNLLDGQIIGDGRSDFTKKSTEYNFIYNNQKFTFIDVPGIEGNETSVIDEISHAVKKAHAIFYITSSSTPPQKGSEKKKGTLEKIKEHLGSQTEVYTIFNKRVTNPIQLNKVLISDDEKESLNIVDQKIVEILGENYAGHKSVSAKLAFLALAECLLSESTLYNERKKFLEKFSTRELVEKANFDNLCRFITDELVVDTKQKIKKSNYNKANSLLDDLINLLHHVSKENFEPLYKQIVVEVNNASDNLKNTLKKIKLDLESVIQNALRDFESRTRKDIYRYIDSNVSDDSFKNKLELLLEANSKVMINSISTNIEKKINKFQTSISEVLENHKRRSDSAIQNYQTFDFSNLDSKFNVNLNIDNGINGWGITGSLMGAGGTIYWGITAGNIWNPAGWTLATLGIVVSAITVVVSFGKSIYKFFSNDYKKSEQRKSADENLENIIDEISPNMISNIKPLLNDLSSLVDKIIIDLENVAIQRRMACEYIDKTHNDLTQLSKNIKREGTI